MNPESKNEGMWAMFDDRQQIGQKRSEAILARIKSFMEKPSPRIVPDEIYRLARNPLSFLFGLIGGLAITQATMMTIGFALAGKIGNPIPFFIAMGSCLIAGICMTGLGWHIRQEIKNVLAKGRTTHGKVLKVKSLASRVNERTFYRVWVEFTDPSGKRIMGKDTIDNFSLNFFIDARDSQQEVEVIYIPGVKKVILPMKLAFGGRLD
jgi:hypothetical protein